MEKRSSKVIPQSTPQLPKGGADRDDSLYPPFRGLGGGCGRELPGGMFYGASPILFKLAKELRINETEAEKYLWVFLSKSQFHGHRFKRQHPVLYFIADFYCHETKLVIEIDGGYHRIPEQYEYDKNRDYELTELGITVIRFTNEEVLFDIDNVLKRISEELIKNK
jgi:cyclase